MKYEKDILIFLILFISIAAVSASEDIQDIAVNSNGECEGISGDDNLQEGMSVDEFGEEDNDNLENAPIDENEISVTGVGDSEGDDSGVNIDAENMSGYYNANPVYKFRISDSDDQPVNSVPVKLHIVGKIYTVYTNLTGEGSLKLNLNPGSYPITVEYANKSFQEQLIYSAVLMLKT